MEMIWTVPNQSIAEYRNNTADSSKFEIEYRAESSTTTIFIPKYIIQHIYCKMFDQIYGKLKYEYIV